MGLVALNVGNGNAAVEDEHERQSLYRRHFLYDIR